MNTSLVLTHLIILFSANVITSSPACSGIASPVLTELNQWQWSVTEIERGDRTNEDDSLVAVRCGIEPGTSNAVSRRNLAHRLP